MKILLALLLLISPAFAEPFGAIEGPMVYGSLASKYSEVIRISAYEKAEFLALAAPILAEAKTKPYNERLTFINVTINKLVKYTNDIEDEWATPLTTLKSGTGDCEDYAFLKQALITELGFKSEIVIVQNRRAKDQHAILAVKDSDMYYMLDNRFNVVPFDSVIAFTLYPLFTMRDGVVYRYLTRMF